jgi:hypothetical protein
MSLDRAAGSEGNGWQTRGQARDGPGASEGRSRGDGWMPGGHQWRDEWTTGGAWWFERVERRVPNGWTCCAIQRDVSSIYAQCQTVRDCDCRPLGGDERARINAIHAAASGRIAAAIRRVWPLNSMRVIACGQFRILPGVGRRPKRRPFSVASCGRRPRDGATVPAERNTLRGILRSRSSTGTPARRRTIRLVGPRRAPVSLRGASRLATSRPAESRRTSYRD